MRSHVNFFLELLFGDESVQPQAAEYLGKKTIGTSATHFLQEYKSTCLASFRFRDGIKKLNAQKQHDNEIIKQITNESYSKLY